MKGEGNESYGAVGKKKSCPRSWELNGLHAGCQLVFRLSVGEHHGRSKKRRLSPEASPAAEELLNVTRDHLDTRERRESKRRTVK